MVYIVRGYGLSFVGYVSMRDSFDLRVGEDMVFLVRKYSGLRSIPPGEPWPFLNRKRMVAAREVVRVFAFLWLTCDLRGSNLFSYLKVAMKDLFRDVEHALTNSLVRRAASISPDKEENGRFSNKTRYAFVIPKRQISTSIFSWKLLWSIYNIEDWVKMRRGVVVFQELKKSYLIMHMSRWEMWSTFFWVIESSISNFEDKCPIPVPSSERVLSLDV